MNSYWDETLPDLLSYALNIIPYKEMLNAAVNSSNHRVMLLGDGYVFDAYHTKPDVMPYLSKEAPGEYPIKLKGVADFLGIDQIYIENITGTFYGGVCFNEVGLLFYIPFRLPVSMDGDLTIKG